MSEQSKAPSAQALDCFIHAVSHLIDEFGFTEGIKRRPISYLSSAKSNQHSALFPNCRTPATGMRTTAKEAGVHPGW